MKLNRSFFTKLGIYLVMVGLAVSFMGFALSGFSIDAYDGLSIDGDGNFGILYNSSSKSSVSMPDAPEAPEAPEAPSFE